MKRISIFAMLVVGLLTVLALIPTTSAQGARAASQNGSPFLQPIAAPQVGPFAAPDQIQCTVSVTTTSSVPNNETAANAATVASYTGLALVHSPTYPISSTQPAQAAAVDNWFVLGNATPNFQYTFQADPDLGGNYNIGMEIYSGSPGALALVYSNVDTGDGNGAKITTAFPGLGPYYIRIFQISSYCSGSTYKLVYSYLPPTGTPSKTPTLTKTVGPTVTPYAGAPSSDRFEPNNSFDSATTIGLNVKYDKLNFVQWDVNSDEWDNDYFKVRVKPGMLVTCRTLDLTAGTDTNLILYDNDRNGINGNDDVNRAGGDLSSSVSYYVTFEGWLYGLAGEGFARPVAEQAVTGYSYECTIGTQFTPTPAPTSTDAPDAPTRTPITPTPTETLIPTPTLTPTPPFVKVEPLPTATSPGLPMSQVPVSLLTYYDANNSNKYDPGEGIVGISARVIDLTTGKLLAQGLTDETGRVAFTVSAPGAIQLVVPYLSFSDIILPSGKAVTVRVSGRDLPRAIP
jgi:hypothetical protein